MKTLIFTNQKGGCGKTTSALTVGAGLYLQGYKVLLVDIDPQGNLSKASGIRPDEDDITICEILKGTAAAADAIRTTPGGYDIIPADIRLIGTDIELASVPGRDFLLREALESVDNAYDFAIIDSPPNLSVITLMGLTAANEVVITLKADFLGLDGVAQLRDTIDLVRKRLNPSLDVLGILLTFYDPRTNLAQTIEAQVEEAFPDKIFEAKITNAVVLGEAPATGRDIFAYTPKNKAKKPVLQYSKVVDEILSRTKTRRKKRTHR